MSKLIEPIQVSELNGICDANFAIEGEWSGHDRELSPAVILAFGLSLRRLARPAGLEPATPSLEGSCSIQLSYGRARAND